MKVLPEPHLSITVKRGFNNFQRKPQEMLLSRTAGFMSTIAIFVVFGVFVSFRPLPFPAIPGQNSSSKLSSFSFKRIKSPVPAEVAILIDKIKHATAAAEKASSNITTFPEADKVSWHRANPCMSRQELWPVFNQRRHAQILEQHPHLEDVLSEYSKLHRACMRNVGTDIIGFFKRKDTSSGCKFVVGDNEIGTGIGNKVLSAVSAVMYSILTQRVLLVPLATSIPGVFCEPFEGSSWKVTMFGVLSPAKRHTEAWHHVSEVRKGVDAVQLGWTNVSSLYATRVNEDWDCQPEKRFFCEAEQQFYETHVTWMYFSECLYYLPKLFAVPRFRPTLEALFPDRMALTHLLRTVMLPADPVWLRVQQLNHVHLMHVDHRVGIQTRYFHGKSDWKRFHEVTENAVAQCLFENHLLPNTSLANTLNEEDAANNTQEYLRDESDKRSEETYSVFITSLYDGLKDHLTKLYVRNPVRTGEAVGILQLTHEDRQQFGVEVDRQALTEVLGLALSDELIATGQSTFGAIASGYGALVPWFIDIRNNTSTGCVRGNTVDACYQLPTSKHYTCPHDSHLNGKVIADVVPYIRDCHLIEKPFVAVHGADLGFQLITNFTTSINHAQIAF